MKITEGRGKIKMGDMKGIGDVCWIYKEKANGSLNYYGIVRFVRTCAHTLIHMYTHIYKYVHTYTQYAHIHTHAISAFPNNIFKLRISFGSRNSNLFFKHIVLRALIMFLLRLSSVLTLALLPKKANLIIQPELPSQTSLSLWMSEDVSVPIPPGQLWYPQYWGT